MSESEIKLSPSFEFESLHQLHMPVAEVSDDFTLYDLFCIIQSIETTYPGLAAIFGMPCFNKFWEQILLDREEDSSDDVEYLELYWSVDYDTNVVPMTEEEKEKWQKDHNYKNDIFDNENNYWDNLHKGELSDLMGFHGIGDYGEEDIKQWPDHANHKCGYAIEYSSVNNLKHLPIRLNTEVSFYQPFVEKGTQLCRTGFILKRCPSFWCFITSVFWELTFCGFTPAEVSAKSSELSESFCDIQKQMDKLDALGQSVIDKMTDDELEEFLENKDQNDE